MKKQSVNVDGFLATFLAIAISLLLIISGAVLYWLYDQYVTGPTNPSPISVTSPISSPTPSLPPTPTPDQAQLLNKITAAFVNQNPDLTDQLQLFLNRYQGEYATGSYQTSEPLKSGWWLAAKPQNEWLIVASGNDNIKCEYLEGYNFPVSLVPECVDQNSGNLIDRATEITVITGATQSTTSATP